MTRATDSISRTETTEVHMGVVDEIHPHRARAHANDFGDASLDTISATHRAGARASNSGEASPEVDGDGHSAGADAIGSALQRLRQLADHYARASKLARPRLSGRTRHIVRNLRRVVCGARRRRDGKPCEALSVPGKRRCKWHGGMSTGPRSAEGKAKVAANLPHRKEQEVSA